jgi:uncharacterized protein YkwD
MKNLFFVPVLSAFFLLAMALSVDAGPFGIFGGRMSSGGCSSGSCGSGGSSAMMMQSSGGWGNAMPQQRILVPETGEVGSLQRTIDFYVNAERARAGLPPVIVDAKMNADLQAATNNSARANASLNDFKTAKVSYKANFARGFQTPSGVVQTWMKVPDLAANILSPDYRTCGYAQAVGPDGTKYWALAMGK